MVDALAIHYSRERIAELLGSVTLLARGPKPVAALKELGLQPAFTAPEPNTWKEVLAVLDSNVQLKGNASPFKNTASPIRNYSPDWRRAARKYCACRCIAGRCRKISRRYKLPSARS